MSVRPRSAAPHPRNRLRLRAGPEEQQQQQQTQETPPPPPPRRGRRQRFADLVPRVLAEYDGMVASSREQVEQVEGALAQVDDQIREMREQAAPAGAVSFMRWARGISSSTVEQARARQAALVAKRAAVAAAVAALEAELREAPPQYAVEWSELDDTTPECLALAGYNWAVAPEGGDTEGLLRALRDALELSNGPGSVVWGTVVASLALAYGLAWAGSWWGVDAYRLLHDTPDPSLAAAWAAWTAPYVGGTLVGAALAPTLYTKSVLRVVAADQQQFYKTLNPLACAAAATAVAFCECLVWQGLWQDVFVSWLGGSRDALALTDPAAVEDSLQRAMGTLVGAPRLPAFLVAPGAAALVGLLEGGYYFTAMAARGSVAVVGLRDESGQESVFDVSPVGPPVLTAEELPLVSARIALAGTYLSLEACLTGSLWLAVGTAAVGIAAAMLASRRS